MTTGVATTRTTIPVTIHGVRLDMWVSVGGLDALTSRAVDRRSGVSGSANLPSPRVGRHGAAPSFRGAGFWCVRVPGGGWAAATSHDRAVTTAGTSARRAPGAT